MNNNITPESNDALLSRQKYAEEKAINRALRLEKRKAAIEKRNLFIEKKSALYNAESVSGEDKREPTAQAKNPANSAGSSIPKQPVSQNRSKTRKNKSRGKNTVATVLSACALLISVALSLSVVFGLIPINNNRSVTNTQISVSDKNNRPNSDLGNTSTANSIEEFFYSVVIINADSFMGTGIVATSDGYIITNCHIIEDAQNVSVRFYNDPTPVSATIVGYSKIDDVAVIKVEKDNLKPATFANSSQCQAGETVYAVGTPSDDIFGWSVTQGIISCANRELLIYDDEGILEKKMYVIQTDASVNPGNSGGPLINEYCEVVGIITLRLSDSVGMGFAIPSNGALELAQAIIRDGHANNVDSSVTSGRPILGITGVSVEENTWYENFTDGTNSGFKEVTEEKAAESPDTTFYAAKTGVYIKNTNPLLDAAQKLQVGDIITELNGTAITNIYQMMSIINKLHGGDTVTIKYYRDGSFDTVTVILGTQIN